MKRPHYLLLPLLLSACATPRQTFERRLDEAISRHRARVGVAVRTPGGETIVREDSLLPMLSVFKFPVALAVLDKAAKEGIPLGQPLAVGPEWLDPDTWSPLRDSLPGTGGIVALADLLRYSVSRSDNIACDRLLEFTGGPSAVQAYVRSLGIDGIRIRASERTMHLAIENQRLNAARPSALCELFERFVEGALLPPDHQALLRHLLETAATVPTNCERVFPQGRHSAIKPVLRTVQQRESALQRTMRVTLCFPTVVSVLSSFSSPTRTRTMPQTPRSSPAYHGRLTPVSPKKSDKRTI